MFFFLMYIKRQVIKFIGTRSVYLQRAKKKKIFTARVILYRRVYIIDI